MTMIGKKWYQVDDRLFEHDGCVLDLGCLGWDWSRRFFGKKKVIGYDPFETEEPEGAELFGEVVSLHDGDTNAPARGSVFFGGSGMLETVRTDSIRLLVEEHAPISVLKMNVEGMEWPLLWSVPHPIADQLVVSFHHRKDKRMKAHTDATIEFLSRWYEPIRTHRPSCWWLFMARR